MCCPASVDQWRSRGEECTSSASASACVSLPATMRLCPIWSLVCMSRCVTVAAEKGRSGCAVLLDARSDGLLGGEIRVGEGEAPEAGKRCLSAKLSVWLSVCLWCWAVTGAIDTRLMMGMSQIAVLIDSLSRTKVTAPSMRGQPVPPCALQEGCPLPLARWRSGEPDPKRALAIIVRPLRSLADS